MSPKPQGKAHQHLAINNVFVNIDYFQSTFLFTYPLSPKIVGFLNKIHCGRYYAGSSKFVWVVKGIVDWYYFSSLASAGAFCYCVRHATRTNHVLTLYDHVILYVTVYILIKFAM